jgi:hypothetical protein
MEIKRSYERDAKFLRLIEGVLSTKSRGDLITYAECDAVLGEKQTRTFRTRIHSWFRQRGLGLVAVAGVGYKVATAAEQVFTIARGHQRKKLSQSRRAIFHLRHAPDAELDQADRVRRQRLLEREASALLQTEDDERNAKQLQGQMPEALPRLDEK